MKKNASGVIWGLLFLFIGVGYLAEVFGLVNDFTIFFDGWWTLFIIIPCFAGLLKDEGDKVGYLIGIAIGLFFLLSAQDIIDSAKLWSVFVAGVFVLIGINLLIPKSRREEKRNEAVDGITADNSFGQSAEYTGTGEKVTCSAVFSGRDIRVDNSYFEGGDLTALFGGIDLNLKNAVITKNVTIEVKAIFGGISLLMPSNVRVVVDVTPILGGVDNGACAPLGADENTPTVYIKGLCMFGGVEVK